MAKPKTPNKPYTAKEREYIERVSGKVPAEIIARQIRRSLDGLRTWAYQHDVKLRVPHQILVKHWSKYASLKTKMQK